MNDLLRSIRDLPWGWAWLIFFVIVTLRAGATYALGRAVAAGILRRSERQLNPRTIAAIDRINLWGPPVVALSFLTVGAQSAVNGAAGLTRMPVRQYLLGLLPGAAMWATVWSTLGMAAFYVALRSGREHTEALLIAFAVLATLIVVGFFAVRSGRNRP